MKLQTFFFNFIFKGSPSFSKLLQDINGIEGYSLKLDVKADGEPLPKIRWFKNGQEIDSKHQRYVINNGPDGSSFLLINKANSSDTGRYSIEAFNKFGQCKCEGKVQITPISTNDDQDLPPSFVSELSDCIVDEGKLLKFEGIIKGNPVPEVNWYHNGESINSSKSHCISFDGQKVILEILNCNSNHKGNYECKLINRFGSKSSKAKAEIREKYAPKFTQKLYDVNTGISVPLNLTCQVIGNPEPDIQWYFEGRVIESGLKYSLKKDGQTLHMTINQPTLKDTGFYECQAKNVCGFDSTRSSITFSEKVFKNEPATFLKRFCDYECREGQSAKFTACIAGNPKPDFKW